MTKSKRIIVERVGGAAQQLAESRRRIREAYPGAPTFTALSGDEVVYRTIRGAAPILVERCRLPSRNAAR